MITSPLKAVFRCASGCAGDHSIWQPIYNCPTCGPDADGPKAWPASCDGLSTGQQDKVSAAVVRDLLSDKEGS